jgi:hydroxyacylglutathione hydrolase
LEIFHNKKEEFSVLTIPTGPLECNCTVLMCHKTGEAAVIDPGGESEWIASTLDSNGSRLSFILLTHAHFDHCLGISDLMRLTGERAIIALHPDDGFWYRSVSLMAPRFGIHASNPTHDVSLELFDGQSIAVGEIVLRVIHTPGHSPGSVSFYFEANDLLIAGDTIFQGSIGRTDLPGGDPELLLSSIRNRIYTLPDKTRIISGHGPVTTVGAEKVSNFFVRP